MVDDDIGGAQTFFQIGTFREPVACNENRKLVIVSDSSDDFEQLFAVIKETVLMRVQMRGTDTHRVGTVDLSAKFEVDFFWVDAGCWFPVVMEITVFIHETWDFVFRSDRAPAVVDAFAGEREMETKKDGRRGFDVVGGDREQVETLHDDEGIEKHYLDV